MAGPDRTDFAGGVVADGDDQVHLRRVRTGELVPALAVQAVGADADRLQRLQTQRVGLLVGARTAAGGVGLEAATTDVVQCRLGQDAARRIVRAEEEDVQEVGCACRSMGNGVSSRTWRHGRLGRRSGRSSPRCASWRQPASARSRRRLGCGALLTEDRNVVQRVELLPGDALRVGDPVLVAARVAAGGLAFVQQGHVGLGGLRLEGSAVLRWIRPGCPDDRGPAGRRASRWRSSPAGPAASTWRSRTSVRLGAWLNMAE